MKIILILSLLSLSIHKCTANYSKNIIIFISDGGGYNQMMCTDFYLYGDYPKSLLASFPVQLAMSTYNGSLQRMELPAITANNSGPIFHTGWLAAPNLLPRQQLWVRDIKPITA